MGWLKNHKIWGDPGRLGRLRASFGDTVRAGKSLTTPPPSPSWNVAHNLPTACPVSPVPFDCVDQMGSVVHADQDQAWPFTGIYI